MTAKKVFEFGGYGAAVILIAFGAAALFLGVSGRSEVRTNLKRERIVGSSNMNREAALEEAKLANLPADIIETLPTCNVVDKPITTGARAKCFASYMRVHTLEQSGGRTYSQLGLYVTKDGKDTNDATLAARDPKTGLPAENRTRSLWVTETALSTALNTAFFAEQVANFSIVVAITLLLSGFGFAVLGYAAFRWLPAYEIRTKAAEAAGKPPPS